MEYLKKDCVQKQGKRCSLCQIHDWVGPEQKRIPQPVPDNENPDHYLDPFKTPASDRFPDDWQLRANIKKTFDSGEPNLETEYWIEEFSKKFAVEKKLVQEYVHHIKDIKYRAD